MLTVGKTLLRSGLFSRMRGGRGTGGSGPLGLRGQLAGGRWGRHLADPPFLDRTRSLPGAFSQLRSTQRPQTSSRGSTQLTSPDRRFQASSESSTSPTLESSLEALQSPAGVGHHLLPSEGPGPSNLPMSQCTFCPCPNSKPLLTIHRCW